ncbi:MAG: BolA family transcriptional regulator [Rhodospirillales bacterium]|nr:BolA family transcriptional regulator [Rhodospirillales bacterium]|tara:strand:- start:1836 stop:2141 length:306 start_codon:yes stop_codon:yes gene_type:complete
MQVRKSLEKKLKNAFQPTWFQVLNESNMHNVPPNSESHFKVIVVSAAFNKKSRIERHQMINAILKEELEGSIHALSIQAHTIEEWSQRSGKIIGSPNCVGK